MNMKIVGSLIGIFALLFFFVILSTVVGGLVGWIVGGVFPFVIDTLNQIAGVNLSGFQVGAVLGFVGSFFRASAPLSSKS